jgi:hypothetical protein
MENASADVLRAHQQMEKIIQQIQSSCALKKTIAREEDQ